MKTVESWYKSNKNLSEYLQIGDIVGECIVEFMYNAMPPATFNGLMVQLGEPYDHSENGRPLYLTVEKIGSNWVYTGIKTRGRK